MARYHTPVESGAPRGQAIVEFALLAPIFFLVVLGIVILGLTVGNQNLFNNGVRDVARAAAVCGGYLRDSNTQVPATTRQAAQSCSWSNLGTYARSRLDQETEPSVLTAPTGGTNCQQLLVTVNGNQVHPALVCLFNKTDAAQAISTNPLDDCAVGYKIEVSSIYSQQLFIPLVGTILGNNGSNTTRQLTADAEATCEQ